VRDATEAVLSFVREAHAAADHQTDPEQLAQAWGVRIIPGSENRATNGPPSIITLRRDTYAPRQRFTTHHELGHILVQRAGLESDIRAEVDTDDADAHLEQVVNHIAALLVMPDPLVLSLLDRHGLTPTAVLEIQTAARVSFAAASRRVVSANSDQPTTVFLCGETYVLDVASTDPSNRLYPYDRLPDARASFPQAALLTRPMPGWVRTVGVVTW
jgi:IrrE N-terminal-like domain